LPLTALIIAQDGASEFGGRKITGLDDFDLALRRVSAGDTVEVTALGAAEECLTTALPRRYVRVRYARDSAVLDPLF
jgi:hypothetical protein